MLRTQVRALRRRARAILLIALTIAIPTLTGTTSASSADTLNMTGAWPGWQKDLAGSRFNPAESQITPQTVAGLKLKWAFAFPNGDGSNGSQPAVVGDTVYVGGRDAKLYALNADTGTTKWTFDVTPIAGPVSANSPDPLRDGPTVTGNDVIVGDQRGFLYAVNTTSGTLDWSTKLSDHPAAVITGSPLVYNGRVYVGVSSNEEQQAASASYPCCTFRGQLVALDAATGAVDWRYYTTPPATQVGTTSSGVAQFAPAGGAVWDSPAIDPTSGTVYFATGNNYSGTAGDTDSVIAVDAQTGGLRWKQQMTKPDTWTVGCLQPTDQPNCPGLTDNSALDLDFGSSPNLFTVNGRLLVGIGQKSGVYHTFDAATGQIVWQQQVSVPSAPAGEYGIQWGTSYDGTHLYVATWMANPGTLFALDPATGKIDWSQPVPSDACTTGGAAAFPNNCNRSMISAVSSSPGLVYEGGADGKMRVYRSSDGANLWQYDTVQQFTGVNGVAGSGGSVSGNGGAVVSNGVLYVQSGYYSFYGIPGNMLLAFKL
jgi:polyvinyl alcohol dehydrogenase (cytochrome)